MIWEKVTENGNTRRMRVPFGWIIKIWMQSSIEFSHQGSVSCSVTSCFVPDPFHWWKIKEVK